MVLAGVDRVMVDLEINGKEKRQRNLDTVISRHSFQDIDPIRNALNMCGRGELMVRINPLNTESRSEIDEVISRGADRIMLPMFTHPDEVSLCLDYISGRVPLTLLLETAAALFRLPRILLVRGFDDIHIGLNDLHLDMGLDFMFELFSSGLLDKAALMIRDSGIVFGVGGVGCLGSGLLPAELILASHLRLGSQRVILSRTFGKTIDGGGSAEAEILKIQAYLDRIDLNLAELRNEFDSRVIAIANSKRLRLDC